MHRPIAASDLPSDPEDFQRLALDALGAEYTPEGWKVRGLDLGTGRSDQGYDGVAVDPEGNTWRVEVKSSKDFGPLRAAVKSHVDAYSDTPTWVLCRYPLNERQRHTLLSLRETPPLQVLDGSQIAAILRAHPWVAEAHGLGAPLGFRPLRELPALPLPPPPLRAARR